MREVLRTTDVVHLSWLQALLADRSIRSVILDSHMSVLEGSANAIPRRLMVQDEDFGAAMRIFDEAGALEGNGNPEATITLLGGRVTLLQPRPGYRVAIDPVFLAAAVPETAGTVLDVGCGTGAAAICLAERVPGVRILGLEIDPAMAHLAAENARLNDMADRITVLTGSLLNPPAELTPGCVDALMANPPYLPVERADLRQPAADRAATVEGDAKLADWIEFCLAMAGRDGIVTLVHRADRLDEILSLLQGRAGGIVVFPLWPGGRSDGAGDAKRVLVQARTGSKAPLRLARGLVLHREDGAYTAAADAILRDGAPLSL